MHLSDDLNNVVAIALTLLVLQLKVPAAAQVANPGSAADLAAQLAKEADALISYVIAFYVVAQFWLAHHRVFRRVAGHHGGLAWWNFAFLFTITAMPFTSSLRGDYGNNPLAVDSKLRWRLVTSGDDLRAHTGVMWPWGVRDHA